MARKSKGTTVVVTKVVDEKQAKVDTLIDQLRAEGVTQADKKRIRRKLRAAGHWGGLRNRTVDIERARSHDMTAAAAK